MRTHRAVSAAFATVLTVPFLAQAQTSVRNLEVPAPGGQTLIIKVFTEHDQPARADVADVEDSEKEQEVAKVQDETAAAFVEEDDVPGGRHVAAVVGLDPPGRSHPEPRPEDQPDARSGQGSSPAEDEPEAPGTPSGHRSDAPRPEPDRRPAAVLAAKPAETDVFRPERSREVPRGSARCKDHWDGILEPLKDARFTLRVPVAQRRKVHLGPHNHLLYDDDTLFYIEEPEEAQITRVRVNQRSRGGRGRRCVAAELHLRSTADHGRRGKLTFTGRAPSEHDFYLWLDQVMAVDTPIGALERYALNYASGTVHLATSNHLTAEAERSAQIPKWLRLCPVCFGVPSLATLEPMPDSHAEPYAADARRMIPGTDDERALALAGWQQVQSYPPYSGPYQEIVERVGNQVLSEWPGLLKGYDYRFLVVDAPMLNAFAIPMGGVVVTKRLMDALETEAELAALLAHEIAHVEARHSYRRLRNARNAAGWATLGAALTNVLDPNCRNYGVCAGNAVGQIGVVIAENFLQGHGREREQEADVFANFYLGSAGIGREPLVSLLSKFQFESEYEDPEGKNQGRTHPHIESRVAYARSADVRPFADVTAFHGLNRNGDVVATFALEFQVIGRGSLRVIASIETTYLLGGDDNVNNLELFVGDEKIRLSEVTAERVSPGESTTAMFEGLGTGLINRTVTGMKMKLRNVRSWRPVEQQ